MVSAILQMLLLACLVPASPARGNLVIEPESPQLEIGRNFTATCVIVNATELTADDLYWNLSKMTVPEEQYTKINRSAVSVTITVTGERKEWLYCHSRRVSPLNQRGLTHGILLRKAYPPRKPENLSCQAVQERSSRISSMSCWWDTSGRQSSDAPTTYTLKFEIVMFTTYSVSTTKNSGSVFLDVYPFHMNLQIWVEARNILGTVESEYLNQQADWFVKTNPPSNVTVNSENSFPTSLLINWTPPITEHYMLLKYEIRLCAEGEHGWTYIPPTDINKDIVSFRLQKLQPDTPYTIQVRCGNARRGPYWSDWSTNATKRTAEDKPASKPQLWKIVAEPANTKERWVELVAKDPALSNGRITGFKLKIESKENLRNGSEEWELIPVNNSVFGGSSGRRTLLKRVLLPDSESMKVSVVAINSVGESPVASLIIPDKMLDLPPVEDLEVRPHGDQLEIGWKPSARRKASEYVLEWRNGDDVDWQRESRRTTKSLIKGHLDRFVRYNVSVYPIYTPGLIGKPLATQAFLEQGAPLEGPVVAVKDNPGHNEAQLVWKEIPLHKRRGFITNYTIFYSNGSSVYNVTVPGNVTSFTLRSLSGNTKYDTWMVASTIRGSARGFNHSFTTQKYAPGEIEAILVGISLPVFFVVLIMMMLCIYKEDMIKKNLCPQIPNPGESTIGSWSPDPIKAETPLDSCVSGVTLLTVDVCDVKCALEDDKAGLPLKRDKYLSEEHSSGIGGSSCMSSPRHSVSDSDEGSEAADTTASTVQYSSVVAVGGYKGQTPSSKLQQVIFSRSESTQPLLDTDEHPDETLGGRRPRNAPREGGPAEEGAVLDFHPIVEEQGASVEGRSAAAPASTYMPQANGYRPQ